MSIMGKGLQVFQTHEPLSSAMHLLHSEAAATLCSIPASAGIVIANPLPEHDQIWSVSHRRNQCASCAWHVHSAAPVPPKPPFPGSDSWKFLVTDLRVETAAGSFEGKFFGFQLLGDPAEWRLLLDTGDAVSSCPVSAIVEAVEA